MAKRRKKPNDVLGEALSEKYRIAGLPQHTDEYLDTYHNQDQYPYNYANVMGGVPIENELEKSGIHEVEEFDGIYTKREEELRDLNDKYDDFIDQQVRGRNYDLPSNRRVVGHLIKDKNQRYTPEQYDEAVKKHEEEIANKIKNKLTKKLIDQNDQIKHLESAIKSLINRLG